MISKSTNYSMHLAKDERVGFKGSRQVADKVNHEMNFHGTFESIIEARSST